MKRYWSIFLLHFQHAFESRSRSFVWFLLALINPLIYLLFWRGVIGESQSVMSGWQLSSIASYYFLLIIANAMLTSHIEETVAQEDIQQGYLSSLLLKPFNYFKLKFFEEIPYRLIQGAFGIVVFGVVTLLLNQLVTITSQFEVIMVGILIVILAFILSFTFKMVVGLAAFWFTDAFGFQQIMMVTTIILGGSIMPLDLMPQFLQQISKYLPFAYMIYYPVMAFTGRLDVGELTRTVVVQLVWLGIFYLLYRSLWKRGIRLFTGVGM